MTELPNEDIILNLLDDPDYRSSTEIMAQLLDDRDMTEDLIATHMDDDAPVVRRHMQILSSVLTMADRRRNFCYRLLYDNLSLWDYLVTLNLAFDPKSSSESLEQLYQECSRKFFGDLAPDAKVSTSKMLKLLGKAEMPPTDIFYAFELESYVLSRVLTGERLPQPLLQCALIQRLGQDHGWDSTIVICNGRFMLEAREGVILGIENESWSIMQKAPILCHCDANELTYIYMSEMYAAALIERNVEAVFVLSQLVARCYGHTANELPYPVGNDSAGDPGPDDAPHP